MKWLQRNAGNLCGGLVVALFLGWWLYADREAFFGPRSAPGPGVSVRVNELPTGRRGEIDATAAAALARE